MIIKRHVITTLLLVIVSFGLFSQENRIARADEKFSAYAYVDARKIYLDVVKSGYASANLFKKLGDSYYFNGELEESVKWFERLVKEYADEIDPEYLFRYSQSLKSVKRYDDSDEVMEKFKVLIGNDQRADFFTNTRDYLKFIDLQSGKFDLLKLKVNSKFSDHAPSFNHQGELVFASSREGNNVTKSIHEWNEMPFLDLFFSRITDAKGALKKPKKLKGKVNTRFHESSTSFSKDGKTVYFTRNNYTDKKLAFNASGTILLKLYRATLNGNKWENVEELPFNNDEYSIAHPALSVDGKKLYFASDMPGTRGLSDIFVVDVYEDGTFGLPMNLGSQINTEGRETFPYISEEDKLYFSSDGHIGLGGLDVFISVPEKGAFSRPYNVGRPVNGPDDDFSFVINSSTKIGYFSSNRKGGKGNDDIYGFEQTGKLITSCKQYVRGKVVDTDTNQLMVGAEVILLDANNQEVQRMITDEFGNYRFKDLDCDAFYVVRVNKEGYSSAEAILETSSVLEHEADLPLGMSRSGVDLLEIRDGDDLGKVLDLKPIHFDFNDYLIREDAKAELAKVIKVMQQHPNMKIEIRSHTDSRADTAYNKKLSARRARKTQNYIMIIGQIDRSRIAYKGFGEEQLLNDCVTGVECSDEEHEKNRRSEFIVIEQ